MTSDPTKISAQPPPQENGKAPPPETSRGETAFDWLAYGGFAGVVTFLLGLPMGNWARHTKSGQNAVKWTARRLKHIGMSEHSAEDFVMTTALMQPGNAMLFPVRWMEGCKPELVASLNESLGDDSGAASLEQEPKQSWPSLIKSRIVAWVAVFASLRGAAHLVGREGFEKFEEGFARHVICEPLGKATHINGKETRLFRLGRIGAIDAFATASAAALLYVGSRAFAKHEEHETWHTVEDRKSEALPPESREASAPAAREGKKIASRFKPVASHAERAAHTETALGPQP